MMPKDKIGSWQMTALLALSQLFWLLTWQKPIKNALAFIGFAILFSAVAVLYIGITGNNLCRLRNYGTGKVLLCFFAVLITAQSAYRLITVLSILLEGMFSTALVLLSLLLAMAAVAKIGMEAFCRAAFVLLFFVGATVIILLAGAGDQLDITRAQQPLISGTNGEELLMDGLALQVEVILYPLLRPAVAKPGRRLYRRYLLLGTGITVLLLALCALVLGDFGITGGYPIYRLARTADLTALSQLTPVFWFLLVCSVVLRMGAFFMVGVELLPLKNVTAGAKKWILCGAFGALLLLMLVLTGLDAIIDITIGVMMLLFLAVGLLVTKRGKNHAKT